MTRKTKEQVILDAAEKLFAERGFPATTTAEIARKAKVAEGLIFHYFQNKDGLLLRIFENMFTGMNEAAREAVAVSGTGMDALENIVKIHFRFLRKSGDKMRISLRDLPVHKGRMPPAFQALAKKRAKERLTILSECIKRGQQDGSIRKVDPRKTAIVIAGILYGVSRIILHGAVDVPPMEDEIIQFCRRSLTT